MFMKRAGFLLVLLPLAGAALVAWGRVHPAKTSLAPDVNSLQSEITKARKEVDMLSRQSSRLSSGLDRFSRGDLIVIDTATNRLYLLNDSKVLLDAPCSTGSGLQLDDPVNGRNWVFNTPRGEFRILSKLVNPVWRKPDWAFIEDGKQPPRDPVARFEEGVLGDYALAFGNGYFIHGTLYTRLIGKNVTHGCVRLKDRDLEALFSRVSVGTPVVIF
jgi:lipoprotein-anchoring transpeptidase ErfK/SrfK